MRSVLVSLTLAVSIPAAAAPNGFTACRSIADPSQRLACYDAAARGSVAPSLPAPDPVTTFGRSAAPPETTEAVFGHPPPPPKPADRQVELQEITSRITQTSNNAEGRLVLILANDQQWVVQGYDRPFPPHNDTPVTIERSFTGFSYLVDLPTGSYLASRRR